MKRRILSTMVALAAIVGGAQAQTLTVQPTEAQTCEQTELVVSLTGGTAMTALQFNLQLPEGVTLDEAAIAKGEAAGGHTLSISTLDGGDRLFVLYSMNLDTFGDGCLLRLPVTAPTEAGTFSGRLYTVRTASVGGGEAVSHTAQDAAFTVTVTADMTGINTVAADGDDTDAAWYDLSGRQLAGKPAKKGIYVKNGKKVVIR